MIFPKFKFRPITRLNDLIDGWYIRVCIIGGMTGEFCYEVLKVKGKLFKVKEKHYSKTEYMYQWKISTSTQKERYVGDLTGLKTESCSKRDKLQFRPAGYVRLFKYSSELVNVCEQLKSVKNAHEIYTGSRDKTLSSMNQLWLKPKAESGVAADIPEELLDYKTFL